VQTRTRTCGSSSMRSSGTLSTRCKSARSHKRSSEPPYTVQDNSRKPPESKEVSNDTVPPGTEGNDDRSPASATLLQQLHFLLHRAVEAPAYDHGSKRPRVKRSTGKERGWQNVVLGVGYQPISLSLDAYLRRQAVTPGTKLPRSLIHTKRKNFFVVESYHFQPSSSTIAMARHGCW